MALARLIVALTELPAMGPTGPATEFRLFPFGPHTSEKGTFVFDKQSAKSILKQWARKGHDSPIDYEHGMVKPDKELPGDGPVPAAGWFSLDVRGDGKNPDTDGLWAVNVKWTPRALAYLQGKEYRFYSPAFLYNPKTAHIEELVNVALTNTPAQHDQVPLIAASDKTTVTEEPRPMKLMLAQLKLSENATEAEALTALHALQAESAKRSDEAQKLMACTGKSTVAEAIGFVEGLKVAVAAGAKSLEQLKELKAEKRERQVTTLIAQGLKEKKITPAQKEHFLELAKQKGGVKLLKVFLDTAAPVVGKNATKGGGKDDHSEADVAQVMATLSADEKRIARDGGITLEAFAKAKAAHTAARGGPRSDAELDA